jgi:hypothetical protein
MTRAQSERESQPPLWLIAASYAGAFILGACIDVIGHAWDRVGPALQAGHWDDGVMRRAVLGVTLSVLVITTVAWGMSWSRERLGVLHRNGLLIVVVLTPVLVYILER